MKSNSWKLKKKMKLNNKRWQILFTLHEILLYKHHDFFFISQHSFASLESSRLIAKYLISAKMWHHEIHVFLKIFRHKLLNFLDYMLTFVYIAYFIIILLYEIVSTFENIWIKSYNNCRYIRRRWHAKCRLRESKLTLWRFSRLFKRWSVTSTSISISISTSISTSTSISISTSALTSRSSICWKDATAINVRKNDRRKVFQDTIKDAQNRLKFLLKKSCKSFTNIKQRRTKRLWIEFKKKNDITFVTFRQMWKNYDLSFFAFIFSKSMLISQKHTFKSFFNLHWSTMRSVWWHQ
jgi:hypothetical protein